MLPAAPSDLRLLDFVLMAILLAALPLWGHFVSTPWRQRKLEAGAFDPIQAYVRSFIMLWGLVLLLGLDWWLAGRDPKALGLVIHLDLIFMLGCLFAAVIMAVLLWQSFRIRGLSHERKLKIAQKNAGVFEIIPSTPRQLQCFVGLSITAGITEELLYRGFLIWALSAYMDLLVAAVLASVLFGLAHAYQGRSGILKTGAIGLVMAMLYIGSGTILLPMLLHAFIDINSGFVSYSLKSELGASPLSPSTSPRSA
jgi:membrane protease YdiL (CAAX protease family)